MKVACAVALLFLFALCNGSAPDCGVNGVQDTYAKTLCNCFSGYQSSNSAQTDCDKSFGCIPAVSLDSHNAIGSFPAFLKSAKFASDRYNVIIGVPIVQGRRNATVRIAGGANTCGYPGPAWSKRVDSLGCQNDELVGSIPWAQHTMCGFTGSDNGTRATYSAQLQVYYDDYIVSGGEGLARTTAVTLRVDVTFVTQASVIFSLINLENGNTMVTTTTVGQVSYSSLTGTAAITVRTNALWPYKVAGITMFSQPYPNTATLAVDVNYDQSSFCTNTANSACSQQYQMVISPNGGCNLGGNYVFNLTLSCRGNSGMCNAGVINAAGSYSVLIYSTDVCGVGGVIVDLSQGSLLPFADAAGTVAASTFVPNQWVYFAFTVTSDAATIDNVIVQKIYAKSGSTQDDFYDTHATTVTANSFTTKGTAAGLVITPAPTTVAPGTPVTLWFKMRLIDQVATFQVLPSAAATVTMNIIAEIQYHGNQKRTVELSTAASFTSSTAATDIYIQASDSSEAGGQNSNKGQSSGHQLNPLSSTFFSVIMALFAVFVAMRR